MVQILSPRSMSGGPRTPTYRIRYQMPGSDRQDGVSQGTRSEIEQQDTLPPGSTGVYPQFLLFGDSITQSSVTDFQTPLQNLYIRRADILNRGFSGYTAEMALKILPQFLPRSTPDLQTSPSTPRIRLLTVFFGANDACLPGTPQHVSLAKYLKCLANIVRYPVLQQHDTKVILITPPPVNEHQLGIGRVLRNALTTGQYACAARELATDLQIPCVDIWSLFLKLAGFEPPESVHEGDVLPGDIAIPENEVLRSLLADGLHLSPKGYQVLYDELMAVIRRDVPSCLPENLPFVFNEWRNCLNCPK